MIIVSYRMIHEVAPSTRNITLDKLEANTEYELQITALFRPFSGQSLAENASTPIRFISPDNGRLTFDLVSVTSCQICDAN